MPNILGLEDWTVLKREEREHDYRVTAQYDIPLSQCPHCGSTDLKRFGRRNVLFMDMPALGKRVGVEVQRQRYRCDGCKRVSLQPLPDIDEKRDATKRLVAYIAEQSILRTHVSVADEVGVNEKTVRNIFRERMDYFNKSFSPVTPRWLGIDEVHIIRRPRCVLANIEERTVVDMLPTRNKPAVYRRLLEMDRDRVEIVTIDMWAPYRDAARAAFRNPLIVVDKWHVVRLANMGLEVVRKAVRASLTDKRRRRLLGDRFILLKRPKDLTDFERLRLEEWSATFPALGLAYALKEGFYGIYDAADKFEAKERYRTWLMSVPKEMERPFHELLRGVANWENYIFSYFEVNPRVTNAYTESLNALIKHIHRNGRGYSFEALRAKVLFSPGVRKLRRAPFERGAWDRSSDPIGRTMERLAVPRDDRYVNLGADITTLNRKFETDGF